MAVTGGNLMTHNDILRRNIENLKKPSGETVIVFDEFGNHDKLMHWTDGLQFSGDCAYLNGDIEPVVKDDGDSFEGGIIRTVAIAAAVGGAVLLLSKMILIERA